MEIDPSDTSLALEAAQIGVWTWDPHTGALRGSREFERLHGTAPETFAGTVEDLEQRVHPADRARVLGALDAGRRGEACDVEYRVPMPGGETRWLHARGHRVVEGGRDRIAGVCVDVTERRLAEREARIHERWLATVLHSIGDAVIATDAEGRITLMNEVAEALTARRLDDVRGARLAEVVPLLLEDSREPIEDPVTRVLREREVVGLANHTVLLRADGVEVPIDDSAAPIRDDSGEIVGVVMVFHDVTDRRQEERRRAFAANAMAQLASSIDTQTTLRSVARLAVPHVADWCGIDLLGPDGTLQRLAVAHVDPDKVKLAHDLHERYPPDPNAPHGVAQVLRTGRSELGTDIPDELLVRSARSPEHLALLRELGLRSYMIVPILCRGERLGVITFVSSDPVRSLGEDDLRLAEELAHSAAIALHNAQLYDQVQHALSSREELLAVVSHDLRNPLNVMMMRAAVLLRRLPDDEASAPLRNDIEMIHRAGRRMERLIRDLLDFARIQAGRLPVDPVQQELAPLLKQATEALALLAAPRGIQVELDARIDGGTAWCDRERVLQVLENLGSNAARFTPEGGRIVVEAEQRGKEIVVAVCDTGPGIPADQRARLFDRYWQAEGGKSREGLGLGLFIARGIVEAQGGRIGIEDAPGGGARFWFTLPLHPDR